MSNDNNNNNNDSTGSNMPEPTMLDLFNLLTKCAQKDDIDEIKASITTANTETAEKIDDVNRRIDSVVSNNDQNSIKIQSLEINLEILKQEQLKNNISISGVPPNIIKSDNNTAEFVIKIAKALGVDYNVSQFTSYAVAGNKFIIVHFYNMKHKQTLMNKIRAKRSLMVEEALQLNSNSQIYLNDHLTPYFNSLYLAARKAKAEKKIFSASSYGGKIRARKRADDAPIIITCANQLRMLIDSDETANTSCLSINSSNTSAETIPTTSNANNQHNHNQQRNAASTSYGNARRTNVINHAPKSLSQPSNQTSQTTKKRKNNENNQDTNTAKKLRDLRARNK